MSGSPTRRCNLWQLPLSVPAADGEPLALVKDLKANGANTVIGPLNWDEKGDPKGFDFGVFQWHADGSSTAAK